MPTMPEMTRGGPGPRGIDGAIGAMIALALLALAVALVWTDLHRGPWYDEFYTDYVTRGGQSWLRQLRESWLADNHPPLFYILARASAWLGEIETRRLLNLAFAALALAGGGLVVRDAPRLLPAAGGLALLLAANPWTVWAGSDLRSYFLSQCAGAVLALSLAALWIEGTPGSRGRRAAYWGALFFAFNTHIITTIIAGALVLAFLAGAAWRKDWPQLRALLVPALASAALFLVVSAIQYPMWEANTRVFWLAPGFDSARYAIEYAVQRTIGANPVVLLAALAGCGLLAREAVRSRTLPGELGALLLLATGVAIAVAGLIAIHLLRPILIEKYLSALTATVAAGVALGFGRALVALPARAAQVLLLAGLAWTLYALAGNAERTVARNSWLGTGRLIAREAARCADTAVHTDGFWNADVMAMSPADNRLVAPYAYRSVARRLGFRIERDGSRRISARCPTLFWAEHDTRHRFDEAAILAHLRNRGFALDAITLYRIGDGWVASDRPLSPAP
ncbi:hypothetical protein [Novosphingobium album (ex Liu et al. 2023)]|uniref:Glycosyltransferase RgtA/B/C/D-like domain-containing protein n=1 Tax=Novosphingobium album (ex Liu et al. 2023) TaxID=3031130 RepID=A0ABT5WRL2_9SPHN|nr:hypothetical protein [Novosphingobium album (ex Liu et al. 2023)]MDE8652666.1 hypothetical protein [Novosphingobium album (ex Liu et al. 2023)]